MLRYLPHVWTPGRPRSLVTEPWRRMAARKPSPGAVSFPWCSAPDPGVGRGGRAAARCAAGRGEADGSGPVQAAGRGPSRAGLPAAGRGPAVGFPPLRSLDNPRLLNNLPAQVSSFIGREAELAAVRCLVAGSRLVTLTGAGGAGKTRLGLQVAAGLVDGSGDGVWFADLAPLGGPDLVAVTVADVLGVRREPGRPVLDTLVEAVGGRRVLRGRIRRGPHPRPGVGAGCARAPGRSGRAAAHGSRG
jgi:hypothetical protein